MKLLDKIAVVTGAGRGIGRAAALGLAGEGAHVVINYNRSRVDADAVRQEIEKMGRKALPVRADVGKATEVDEMISQAMDTFGRIDILVNSAGINPRTPVMEMSEDLWDRTINTNLKGVFLCCRSVLTPMMQQKGGRIISMASGRGVTGQAHGAHYAASKGGIIGFTKSLALEVAGYGINVNAIAPGAMDTAMWRDSKSPEEIAAKLKKPRLPGGVGKPEEIAGPVVFLSSEDSRYITGQVIFMKTP